MNNPDTQRVSDRISELSAVERDVFRDVVPDFHMSYAYSQGRTAPQYAIFDLLRYRYESTWSDDKLKVLQQLPKAFSECVKQLPIPGMHKKSNDFKIVDTYTKDWAVLEGAMVGDQRKSELELGRFLAATMVTWDRYYMGTRPTDVNGRPCRNKQSDPYESLFRTYVMHDAGVKSPAYTAVFENIRTLYAQDAADKPASLRSLARGWERRHVDHDVEQFRTDACFFAGSLLFAQCIENHPNHSQLEMLTDDELLGTATIYM